VNGTSLMLSKQPIHHLAMVATASGFSRWIETKGVLNRCVARMALYELFYCATSLAAEREIF
jgi:hypothetical protein